MTSLVPPARFAAAGREAMLAREIEGLVERVAATCWQNLDTRVRDATGALVLDALGLAAAAPAAPSLPATARALTRAAGGRPDAGAGVHVPFGANWNGAADAAAALSVAIHAWDFDDTHDDAVVHTACIALPAALTAAQECGASGRRVLEGVVAGVEVLGRLSLALGPQPGVIRTAGLGSLAAAAATSRVLGLGRAATEAALGLALPTALGPSSRQVVLDSAVSKRHQPSLSVHAGVVAAYLAAEGVTGPTGWWAGEHGLARHVSDPSGALRHLRRDGWEVTRVSLKPYPACRYAHAAVSGLLSLTGGRPDPNAHVHVHLPVGSTHVVVSRPFERRGLPIVDAQFSVPWLVAAALVRGRVGLPEMTAGALLDPEIEHAARTQVTVTQDQDPGTRVMTPVVVEKSGTTGSSRLRVDALPGSPEDPLTRAQQRAKVRGCLQVAGWSAADQDRGLAQLETFVDDLAELDKKQLTARLRELGASAVDESDQYPLERGDAE